MKLFISSREEANRLMEIESLNKKIAEATTAGQEAVRQIDHMRRAEKEALESKVSMLTEENNTYKGMIEKQDEIFERARKVCEKEFSSRLEDYQKVTEDRIESIVSGRVETSVGQIKGQNEALVARNADLTERMTFYKERFEGGKIELGADEIKGILLAANPSGESIVKALKQGN